MSYSLQNKTPAVLFTSNQGDRSPVLTAEYLNGERMWMSLHNLTDHEVGAWLDYYRTMSGAEFMSQSKMVYSDNPSVQGTWHPHVHSDPSLALAQFPDQRLSEVRNTQPSASQQLLQSSSH